MGEASTGTVTSPVYQICDDRGVIIPDSDGSRDGHRGRQGECKGYGAIKNDDPGLAGFLSEAGSSSSRNVAVVIRRRSTCSWNRSGRP